MSSDSLLAFPCDFPIKVMGENSAAVRAAVQAVVARHLADRSANATHTISERPSRTGKYVSITVTLQFGSQEELDRLYQEMVDIDGVSMVL